MREHVLQCPNCGASIDIDDGLDTFYCKYCGYKIILMGQSDQAYRSRTEIQGMRHRERMLDKEFERERERENEKRKKESRGNLAFILGMAALCMFVFVIWSTAKYSSNKEERQLQAIVSEVQEDIKNKDFSDAYIKAQSIVYTAGYSDDIEEKWEKIQDELIEQIKVAEKEETGKTTHKKKGFLRSIFGG